MNKEVMPKYLAVIAVLVIIVGVAVFYLNGRSTNTSVPTLNTKSSQGGVQDQTGDLPSDGSSRYVEYSKEVLGATTDKKRVLYFYANWCPTCIPADENFKSNIDRIPEDVVLIRVNYNDDQTDDEEKALEDRYGITYQHTFVQIDENGNEITKWNGGQTDELLANLK